jgi:RimJ/RimL family protein N-acetyltransferase
VWHDRGVNTCDSDDQATPSTVIGTSRLWLRAYRDDDLPDLVSMAGTWEVASWLSALPFPYTEDHGREWIAHVRQAHAAGSPRAFAIALKGSDRLIGGAGLDGRSGDGSSEPSLGYWLGLPYRKQGYAREAVGAVIGYGFRTLGLDTMRAVTDPENAASQEILLACGLRKVGDINLAGPMRRGAAGRRCSASRGTISRQWHEHRQQPADTRFITHDNVLYHA